MTGDDADSLTLTPPSSAGPYPRTSVHAWLRPAPADVPLDGILTRDAAAGLCRLTVAGQGALPGRVSDILDVSHHLDVGDHTDGARDDCARATAVAAALRRELGAPAPPSEAAPAELGIRAGRPDDAVPAACGLMPDLGPADCRPARPADVRARAADTLTAAATGGADLRCALLTAAADPSSGPIEAVATTVGDACVARATTGPHLQLLIVAGATARGLCRRLAPEPVAIGGRPGLRCSPDAAQDAVLLDVGSDDDAAVLAVAAWDRPPRGTLSLDSVGTGPSSAAARAATGLAERALARAFG